MWTKTTTLTALLFIARFGSGVEAEVLRSLKSKPSNKSSKAGKTVCLEFGFETDVVLPDGPIPAADSTCTPGGPDYDPQQCPVYFDPFFLESASSASSQYEQVDGRDALCIVSPLSSTASDKFFMTYFGTLSSDVTDTSGLLYPDTPLSDFEKLSYDFYVDACQGTTKTSCPEQFYTGVYARESAAKTNFFDCRFNFVPDMGGVEGTWTTFTFTADTPGRACGNSACTDPCATGWTAGAQYSLNEYIAAVPGAVLSSGYAQAFNLNIGDSAAGDAGLRGCYGDIRFTLAGNTDVLKFTA